MYVIDIYNFTVAGNTKMDYYYFLAFLLGIIAAIAELLSRYTDGFRIFKVKESYPYLLINGFTSVTAYWYISTHNIAPDAIITEPLSKVLTAGIGSMVILRSSVASIKVGDKTIEAGFAPILNVFLNTADRAFDRCQSKKNINEIATIMKDVDFSKAHKDLPATCFNSLQNAPEEQVAKCSSDIQKIVDSGIDSNFTKSLNLGICISKIAGNDLLKEIVTSLNTTIKIDHKSTQTDQQADSISNQRNKIKELKSKFSS